MDYGPQIFPTFFLLIRYCYSSALPNLLYLLITPTLDIYFIIEGSTIFRLKSKKKVPITVINYNTHLLI